MRVAGEVDGGNRSLDALIDIEDDLLLPRLRQILGCAVDGHALESIFGVGAFDGLGRAAHQRLFDGVADVEIDLLSLQRLIDLCSVQLLVAAELHGADARSLLHDRSHDDAAAFATLGLDADVIEEAGLPQIEKVLSDQIGVVWLPWNDAQVDACNRCVTNCFESFNALPGEGRGGRRGRRGRFRSRRCGDAPRFRPLDDRARLRFRRRLIGGRLRPGCAGDKRRQCDRCKSSHRRKANQSNAA